MKNKTVILLIIALALGFAGGVLFAKKMPEPNSEKPKPPQADPMKKLSTDIVNNILDGIKKDDYAVFSKDFQQIMKTNLPPETFKAMKLTFTVMLRNMKGIKWLGSYNKSGTIINLFKTITKDENDTLMTLALVEVNGQWQVVGFYMN